MEPFTLDQLTAAPRTLRAAGRELRVHPLTLRRWGVLQAWLKDNGPSPLRSLKSGDLEGLSDEDRATLLREALRQQRSAWPPPIASREWFAALSDSPGGDDRFLWELLLPGHPGMTLEEAAAIRDAMTKEETLAVTYLAIGLDPPAPKSPAPAPAEGTAATTTGPDPDPPAAPGATPGAPDSTP